MDTFSSESGAGISAEIMMVRRQESGQHLLPVRSDDCGRGRKKVGASTPDYIAPQDVNDVGGRHHRRPEASLTVERSHKLYFSELATDMSDKQPPPPPYQPKGGHPPPPQQGYPQPQQGSQQQGYPPQQPVQYTAAANVRKNIILTFD